MAIKVLTTKELKEDETVETEKMPALKGMEWWMWPRADQRLNDVWAYDAQIRMYSARFDINEKSHCDFQEREIVINPEPSNYNIPSQLEWRGIRLKSHTQFNVQFARTLTFHEVMHVLFTDPNGIVFANAIHMALTNMLEDERGERLASLYHPEWRAEFDQLGALFWAKGRDSWHPRLTWQERVASTCFFERWDAAARARGEASKIDDMAWFKGVYSDADADKARVMWERVRPLVHSAWSVKSTFDVAAIAYRIMCMIWPDPAGDPEKTSLETGEARRGAQRIQYGTPASGATDGEIPDDSHFDGKGEDKGKAKGRMPGDKTEDGESGGGEGEAEGDGHTKIVREKLKGEKEASGTGAGGRGMVPDSDIADDKPIVGTMADRTGETLTGGNIVPVLQDAKPLIKRIAKILEVPTEDEGERPSDTRGKFSVANLVKTRGEKPLAFRDVRGYSPKGMAICLVIDGSGSMGYPTNASYAMYHVVRATLALERACAGEGVKFQGGLAGGDYIVGRGDGRPLTKVLDLANPGRHVQIKNVVRWFKTFDSPSSSDVMLAQIAGLHGGGADESVSASLRIAHALLESRPEPTKLILSIHDGQPTDETREKVKETADRLRALGANISSIGIAPPRYVGEGVEDDGENYYTKEMEENLHAMFGTEPEYTLMVKRIDQLPQKLGYMVNRYRK